MTCVAGHADVDVDVVVDVDVCHTAKRRRVLPSPPERQPRPSMSTTTVLPLELLYTIWQFAPAFAAVDTHPQALTQFLLQQQQTRPAHQFRPQCASQAQHSKPCHSTIAHATTRYMVGLLWPATGQAAPLCSVSWDMAKAATCSGLPPPPNRRQLVTRWWAGLGMPHWLQVQSARASHRRCPAYEAMARLVHDCVYHNHTEMVLFLVNDLAFPVSGGMQLQTCLRTVGGSLPPLKKTVNWEFEVLLYYADHAAVFEFNEDARHHVMAALCTAAQRVSHDFLAEDVVMATDDDGDDDVDDDRLEERRRAPATVPAVHALRQTFLFQQWLHGSTILHDRFLDRGCIDFFHEDCSSSECPTCH